MNAEMKELFKQSVNRKILVVVGIWGNFWFVQFAVSLVQVCVCICVCVWHIWKDNYTEWMLWVLLCMQWQSQWTEIVGRVFFVLEVKRTLIWIFVWFLNEQSPILRKQYLKEFDSQLQEELDHLKPNYSIDPNIATSVNTSNNNSNNNNKHQKKRNSNLIRKNKDRSNSNTASNVSNNSETSETQKKTKRLLFLRTSSNNNNGINNEKKGKQKDACLVGFEREELSKVSYFFTTSFVSFHCFVFCVLMCLVWLPQIGIKRYCWSFWFGLVSFFDVDHILSSCTGLSLKCNSAEVLL